MFRWIYILMFAASAAACAPELSEYRGGPARTGDYGSEGISALDQIAWKYRAPSGIAGSPAVGHGRVYVAEIDGRVTALDQQSGEVVWTLDLGVPVYGTPVSMKRRVVVGTDGGLRGIDLEGSLQWSADGAAIDAAPLIIDGVAYVGARDGSVLAVDAVGGSLIWSASTAGPVSAPVVQVGDDIVAGSSDGSVYRLDRRTGEPRWSWAAGNPVRGVSFSDGQVFVAAGTRVVAIPAESPQASAWQFDLGAAVATPPTISGNTVFAGTGAGDLVGIDVADGHQQFRRTLGAPVRGDIIAARGRLIVPASRSGLQVTDQDGEPQWRFGTDGIVGGAVPHKQALYVTDREGSVYALH